MHIWKRFENEVLSMKVIGENLLWTGTRQGSLEPRSMISSHGKQNKQTKKLKRMPQKKFQNTEAMGS